MMDAEEVNPDTEELMRAMEAPDATPETLRAALRVYHAKHQEFVFDTVASNVPSRTLRKQ